MTTKDADHNFACDATSLEQIVGLREDTSFTVRRSALCKKLSENNCASKSKRVHGPPMQRVNEKMTDCQQQCRVRSSVQLPSDVKSSGDTSNRHQLSCYSNYLTAKALLITSIRGRLSLSLTSSKKSLTPPSTWKLKNSFLISTLFLVTIFATSGIGSASTSDSAPLIRTDVSQWHGRIRTLFNSKLPFRSHHHRVTYNARSRSRRTFDAEKLHFQTMKLIKRWGDATGVLLVGGRDYIYMIDPKDSSSSDKIPYLERLKWSSSADVVAGCKSLGKTKYECGNFIRVVEVLDDGRLYVCGTNAYRPACRHYSRANFDSPNSQTDSTFLDEEVCRDQCESPYNPSLASVSLYANTTNGNRLFTAVIKDYLGNEPVLMRKNDPYVYSFQKWFNDPTFIKLIEYNGKVYLFFREVASDVETGTTPTTYGRIAQVCKDDVGGTTVLRYQWTTFLKARLKCSLPGTDLHPGFTFNNLTGVSDVTKIVTSNIGRRRDVIFATFTTPWDWPALSMSAVCVFSMDAIQKLFNRGEFLDGVPLQASNPSESGETDVKAVPVADDQVPSPRPGKCPDVNTPSSDKTHIFIKDHFLMYEPVLPLQDNVMFLSERNVRMTRITVDDNAGYAKTPIVYVGTEKGKMLRMRPRYHIPSGPRSVLLEEMRIVGERHCNVSQSACSVLDFHITRPNVIVRGSRNLDLNQLPSAFVAFTDTLKQVPLAACNYTNAECCNVDPDCGWENEDCVQRTSENSQSLPPIYDVRTIPSNCRRDVIRNSECSLENWDPELREAVCKCSENNKEKSVTRGCSTSSTQPIQVNLRSVITSRKDTRVSDDPVSVNRVSDEGFQPRKEIEDDSVLAILNDIVMQDVIPRIQGEFAETMNLLTDKEQRKAFLNQLKDALIDTAGVIMTNHRQEYCLPTQSVNSVAHVYPLLLHEVEKWHELALKKMVKDVFSPTCFSQHPGSPCSSARLTFSMPFAPSLWKPLTHLLTEFSASCDNVTGDDDVSTHSTHCGPVPGLPWCKDQANADSPHCQVKTCEFPRYAVDVKAFFRHINDTRNFLPATRGLEPFYKSVNVTISRTEAVKGHLELLVNEQLPFQISYIPTTEKIKISFHFRPVRDCNLYESGCAGGNQGCNPAVEGALGSWLNSIITGLKPNMKKCLPQQKRFERSLGQLRNKRSFADGGNELPLTVPDRCRYVKKRYRFVNGAWDQLVHRAQERGGFHNENAERIEFYSRDDIKLFFQNRCSVDPPPQELTVLGRTVLRKGRPRTVDVKLFASRELPLVIEKLGPNRVRLKYFVYVPDN